MGGLICSTNEIFVCCVVFDPKSSEKPKGWERISGLYHTICNIARGCVYFCEICWAHIFTQIHMYVMLFGQNSGGFCTFVTPSQSLLPSFPTPLSCYFFRLCFKLLGHLSGFCATPSASRGSEWEREGERPRVVAFAVKRKLQNVCLIRSCACLRPPRAITQSHWKIWPAPIQFTHTQKTHTHMCV